MLIREEQLHKLTLDIATVTKKNEELVSTYDTKLKLVEQNVKKADQNKKIDELANEAKKYKETANSLNDDLKLMKQKSSEAEKKYLEEINMLQSQTKSALVDSTIKAENKRLKDDCEKLKGAMAHKDLLLNNEIKKNHQLLLELESIKSDIVNEYKEIETLKKVVTPHALKQNISFTLPIKQPSTVIHAFEKPASPYPSKNISTFQKTVLVTLEESDPHTSKPSKQ